MAPMPRVKPTTIDEYLAPLPVEQRVALQRLRMQIKAAAPRAVECISYGIPGFRLDGKVLVHFGAASKHCSFYPGAVVQALQGELAGYDTSKGTVRFQPDAPLPSSLVRKLVEAQIARRAPRAAKAKRASAKTRGTAATNRSVVTSRRAARGAQLATPAARMFRRIALGLAGVVEGKHTGHADFRAGGRIFATLCNDGECGTVKLTPEQQQELIDDNPAAFAPTAGAWGRGGYTTVRLDAVDEETLGAALTFARRDALQRSAK